MKKALGYARISLSEENIGNQILEIRKFAERNGYYLVKVFEDKDISGSVPAFERPGFKKTDRRCTTS